MPEGQARYFHPKSESEEADLIIDELLRDEESDQWPAVRTHYYI
jgi:hypothetical protein